MSVSEKRDWYDKNCNKGTRRMFRNIYGLDLGTYEIKIYDKRRDRIRSAKNVIAIRDEKDIFAVGNAAYAMYEKAPENIQVVFPMHHGVIARFHEMQYLLCALLKREGRYPNGAEYVIAAPTDVTEVEKKAFYDLVHHSAARAKTVRILDRAIADAVGMGLDVFSAKGVFVVNFGGETTELSVLSGGKTVLSRLLPVGGAALDEAIVASVRHNKEFLIGRITAEQLRWQCGILKNTNRRKLTVAGRDLAMGVPGARQISDGLVRAAMKDSLSEIVRAIQSMIERTPPDVRSEILKSGIYLTGGLARSHGLPAYLRQSTGLLVTAHKNPELCAVKGLRTIISDKHYRNLAYEMSDEDYRWLR